jgi:Xaa-Pro aminopeptidase
MITMEPVSKVGRTVWDRSLLPETEFAERVAEVRACVRRAGFDVLIAIGHSSAGATMGYVTGLTPAHGWMAVVLGHEGDPVLVCASASRDVAFLRTQTWLSDIRSAGGTSSTPAQLIADAVAELTRSSARVGITGAGESLGADDRVSLLRALEGHEVGDARDVCDPLRSEKRAREIIALRRSLDVARAAAASGVAEWRSGASNARALIEAEYAARRLGARDARVLGNVDGEFLQPIEGPSETRASYFTVVCAIEHFGYWGRACATSVERRTAADRALDSLLAATSPGARASDVAAAALPELPGGATDDAWAYGLGGGVGVDIIELPHVRGRSSDVLHPGSVVAFNVVTADGGSLVCAGETVQVLDDRTVRL